MYTWGYYPNVGWVVGLATENGTITSYEEILEDAELARERADELNS